MALHKRVKPDEEIPFALLKKNFPGTPEETDFTVNKQLDKTNIWLLNNEVLSHIENTS